MKRSLGTVVTVEDAELGDLIGFIGDTPLFLIGGGAEDGDSDDEPDDEDGDEEEDDADEEVTISKRDLDAIRERQRELDALRERQRKLTRESVRRRKYLEDNGIDVKTGKKLSSDDEDDDVEDDKQKSKKNTGIDKATLKREVERAVARVEMKYKMPMANLAAERALLKAGFSGKSFDRVLKLIDLEEVEVEGSEVVGIDDQINSIKAEFPEWFKSTKRGNSGGSSRDVDGGSKETKSGSGKTLSARDKLRKQMVG